MLKAAIAYLESKTPTWVKVIVALFVVGWNIPLAVRDWFDQKIDTRVHAVITPINKDQDNRITNLNERMQDLSQKTNETNAFVRAMALHSLGAKKYEEVSLTATK